MPNPQIMVEIEQGTPEWHQARLGKITASNFADVLAKGQGKTRATYMRKLAGERITGNVAESYKSADMERGNALEGDIFQLYRERTGLDAVKCGFILAGTYGYSPDGLIGDDGLVEIKSRLAHIQIESLLTDKVPSENVAQIQGGLFISGREWIDYVSHCPGLPAFIKRVEPDKDYHAMLGAELAKFEQELQEMVNRIAGMF